MVSYRSGWKMRHPGLLLALCVLHAVPVGAAGWPPTPEEVAAVSHVGMWSIEEHVVRDQAAEAAPAERLGHLETAVLTERVKQRDDAPSYTARGLHFLVRGRPDKARADFDRALRKEAGHVPALFLRGLAQERAGRFDEAREDYRRAGELGGPEDPSANAAVASLAMILDPLPEDQMKVVRKRGAPPRFAVRVFTVDGERTVRLETWEYPAQGRSYTFLDGRLGEEERIPRDGADHLVGLHRPWQLVSGMRFEDVVVILRQNHYDHLELADDVVAQGDLLTTSQLVLGFKTGNLFYAHSEPLVLE